MNKQIFISYKRDDIDLVSKVKDEIITNTGVDCWIDLSGIESGDGVGGKIRKAIYNSDVCLFMLTKAFASPYIDPITKERKPDKPTFCGDEVICAKGLGKRLVAISLDGTLIEDLPCDEVKFAFTGTDYINYNNVAQRRKLYRNLRDWCGDPLGLNELERQEETIERKKKEIEERKLALAQSQKTMEFELNEEKKMVERKLQIEERRKKVRDELVYLENEQKSLDNYSKKHSYKEDRKGSFSPFWTRFKIPIIVLGILIILVMLVLTGRSFSNINNVVVSNVDTIANPQKYESNKDTDTALEESTTDESIQPVDNPKKSETVENSAVEDGEQKPQKNEGTAINVGESIVTMPAEGGYAYVDFNCEKYCYLECKKDWVYASLSITEFDWVAFQDAVNNSSIEDKAIILRCLSMYADPDQRVEEVRKFCVAYKILEKEIMPNFYNNIEISVDENLSRKARKAVLVIKTEDGKSSRTITIKQKGKS